MAALAEGWLGGLKLSALPTQLYGDNRDDRENTKKMHSAPWQHLLGRLGYQPCGEMFSCRISVSQYRRLGSLGTMTTGWQEYGLAMKQTCPGVCGGNMSNRGLLQDLSETCGPIRVRLSTTIQNVIQDQILIGIYITT